MGTKKTPAVKAVFPRYEAPSEVDAIKAEAQRDQNYAVIGVLWEFDKKRRNERKFAESE